MIIRLDGSWTLAYGPAYEAPAPDSPELACWPTIAAQVPGNLELDLAAAGLIEDPRVGEAAWRVRGWEDRAWWYRRRFDVAELADEVDLVCEGLDCFATVWINGVRVGDSANALVVQRFSVAAALRVGENEVAIRIAPAVVEGRRRVVTTGEHHVHSFGWESLSVRKPPHQYGWDILPRLVLGGLYRSVRLEAVAPVRFREVALTTLEVRPQERAARVAVMWDAELPDSFTGWRWRLRLARGERVAWSHEAPLLGSHGSIVDWRGDVELWWPRGWGEPVLYEATIEILDERGAVRAVDRRRIGLRTIALHRVEARPGDDGDFGFVVNGERFFARGTNWVPLDALHARDAEHRDAALGLLWDSGSNCVRMWGGNVYESDEVFDWCDERGILVWQDFALACACYPQDRTMREALAAEAAAVIRRLRHHACLALFCGGNETDEATQWARTTRDPNDDALTREVLAEAVRAHDPLRSYLPSSPYLSRETLASGVAVESHLWGARDDWLSPYYLDSRASFISEIGWHGCPAPASLARMQPAGASLWPLTDERWLPQAVCAVREDRAHAGRLGLLARQAALICADGLATLDDFCFASQVAQAEALKTWVERARARKGRMWGLLWWNLRDGWPVISDAVVDYFGRRKLAFAVLAACQAEVVVLVERPRDGRHRVLAVNDRLVPVRISVRVADKRGDLLRERELEVPANGVAEVGTLAVANEHALWRLSWSGEAEGANHYLAGPRPWKLSDLRRWYESLGLRGDGLSVAPALSARS